MKTNIANFVAGLALCSLANVMIEVSSVQAASITTLFAEDNASDGNMFDVRTSTKPITINSIAVNVDKKLAKKSIKVNFYTRSGTYQGFENSSAGWTLIGSTVATGADTNTPTLVDIPDFTLPANTVTGFYVDLSPNSSADLTPLHFTGNKNNPVPNGFNTIYSNADLQITLGKSLYRLFGKESGGYISTESRVWNGTINYTPVVDSFSIDAISPILGGAGLLIAGGIVGVILLRKNSQSKPQSINSETKSEE